MKKNILVIVLTSFFFVLSFVAMAASEPVDPGSEPQQGDPPLGGGAPIGGGTLILIGLGAAYGAKKVYNLVDANKENLED